MARLGSMFKHRGASLIEVLVALTIFSIVLLGLMAIELDSVKAHMDNYFNSVAAIQASSMLERLRANHSVSSREREYIAWNVSNQAVLPDGHGAYQCKQAMHECTVTLKWFNKTRHVFAMTGKMHAPA